MLFPLVNCVRRRSFWSWFDVNRSTFQDAMREKNGFCISVPVNLTFALKITSPFTRVKHRAFYDVLIVSERKVCVRYMTNIKKRNHFIMPLPQSTNNTNYSHIIQHNTLSLPGPLNRIKNTIRYDSRV